MPLLHPRLRHDRQGGVGSGHAAVGHWPGVHLCLLRVSRDPSLQWSMMHTKNFCFAWAPHALPAAHITSSTHRACTAQLLSLIPPPLPSQTLYVLDSPAATPSRRTQGLYINGMREMPLLVAQMAPRARVPATVYVPAPLQANGWLWCA